MNSSSISVACHETNLAVDAIQEHGYVILKDAVPYEPLAKLRDRMDRDTEELLAYCETIGGNPRERGHLQQGPPLSANYVFADVAMNEYVNRVCCGLFDDDALLTFYNGNTNCPGSTTQSLHMDGRHGTLAPEPVHETLSVVVDILPNPMSASNGAIQIWPGSHVIRPESGGPQVPNELEEERRAVVPPIQPEAETGDVLIRDIRLWHRGVPNPSARPRHMLALIVTSGKLNIHRKLRFEKGCEEALEGHSVDANAEYVDGPLEYLIGPTRRIYEARQKAKAERERSNAS